MALPVRSRSFNGRTAAAIVGIDQSDSFSFPVLYDDEVEVKVSIQSTESVERVQVRLVDVWQLIENGVEIVDVAMPSRLPPAI